MFRRAHPSLLFGSPFPRHHYHAVLATCKAVPDRRILQTSPLFYTKYGVPTESLRGPGRPTELKHHRSSGDTQHRVVLYHHLLTSGPRCPLISLLFPFRAGSLPVVWFPLLQTLGRTRTPQQFNPSPIIHPYHPSPTSTRSSPSIDSTRSLCFATHLHPTGRARPSWQFGSSRQA